VNVLAKFEVRSRDNCAVPGYTVQGYSMILVPIESAYGIWLP